MRRDAILKLIEILEQVEDKNFNLEVWECGTTACAVGHAMIHPWFNDIGLFFAPICAPIFEGRPDDGLAPVYKDEYGAHYDMDAVEACFGVSRQQARYLFLEDYYVDKKGRTLRPKKQRAAVIARLRSFVQEEEK